MCRELQKTKYHKFSDSNSYSGLELQPWTFQWDLTLHLLIWTVLHINRSLHQWVFKCKCSMQFFEILIWNIGSCSVKQTQFCTSIIWLHQAKRSLLVWWQLFRILLYWHHRLHSSPKEVHIDFVQFSRWPWVTDPDLGSCRFCQWKWPEVGVGDLGTSGNQDDFHVQNIWRRVYMEKNGVMPKEGCALPYASFLLLANRDLFVWRCPNLYHHNSCNLLHVMSVLQYPSGTGGRNL